MKLTPLVTEEAAKQGYTHRLDFSYRDITAGIANNTAETFTVATTPDGTVIFNGILLLVTPFEDLSDTALNDTTVSLGDGDSATRFFSGIQLNRNGTEVYNTLYSTPYLSTPADTLILTINSMTAKSISNLDAGQAVILLTLGNENRAAIIDAAQP